MQFYDIKILIFGLSEQDGLILDQCGTVLNYSFFAGPDQGFLHKYVWPWAKKDAMQHDSYLCKHYSRTRAFPVQRKNESNNFVAAVVGEKQYIWQPCPEKCRPVDHKDWTYC